MQTEKSFSLNQLESMVSVPEDRVTFTKGGTIVARFRDIVFYNGLVLRMCMGLIFLLVSFVLIQRFYLQDSFPFQNRSSMMILAVTSVFYLMLIPMSYRLAKHQDKQRQKRNAQRARLKLDNALNQLRKEDASVRISAIRTLGSLLDRELIRRGELTIKDHNRIIEVLAKYLKSTFSTLTPHTRKHEIAQLPEDVRAVIGVLGNRRWSEITNEINLNVAKINFQNANFKGANLKGANFSEARFNRAIFKEANLEAANFARAILGEANFEQAKLAGAILSGTSLAKANMKGSDLTEANLAGAVLCEADLEGANLRGAQLQGATVSGADLRGVALKGANLTGAYYSSSTRFPDNFHPEKYGMCLSDF